MSKAKNKTRPTAASPAVFVEAVEHPQRRADAEVMLNWFSEVTGLKPKMWGPGLIGYGRYHYKYESGREGDFFLTGFSPRKANLVFYVMPGYQFDAMREKLSRLGKYKIGKSCLYVNKLDDIDLGVLREIIEEGIAYMRKNYVTFDC